MTLRRLLSLARHLAIAAFAGVVACTAAPEDKAVEAPADTQDIAAPPATRRPTRRYYLGRTQERCEVYSTDGDALSSPTTVHCPPDLQPGERLRLAGKACLRESPSDPLRNVPVICPPPLTAREKADRDARDAGK
jgi:hypothetical protein